MERQRSTARPLHFLSFLEQQLWRRLGRWQEEGGRPCLLQKTCKGTVEMCVKRRCVTVPFAKNVQRHGRMPFSQFPCRIPENVLYYKHQIPPHLSLKCKTAGLFHSLRRPTARIALAVHHHGILTIAMTARASPKRRRAPAKVGLWLRRNKVFVLKQKSIRW